MELAEKWCNVTAWFSPAIRDTIIIGSTTLVDLGFSKVEDIPGGVICVDKADAKAAPPWEIPIKDPDRYPGQDTTEEIEAGWMTPFHKGWMREVVYRYNKPNICEIYYRSPDGTKLRSKTEASNYFRDNPHLTMSPEQLCWRRKPLGLNNLYYEVIRQARPKGTQAPPPPNVFHECPGDISAGSWAALEPAGPKEDFNANTKDFKAEPKTYARAHESREDHYI